MNRSVGIALGGAGLVAALGGLAFISSGNYLLFHSLVEGFSIVIAFAIFFLVWNSRAFQHNNYLLFLGTAFPFIGFIDFLHLLSYSGMGVFQGYGANLPTQLWIQARYLQALTFLLAPLFFSRKVREKFVLGAYIAVTGLLLYSVFGPGIFPECYADPGGLTPFKKVSEYIISLILAVSLVLVVRRQELISRTMFRYLAASILTTIGSELAFTFYVDVFGVSNMVGHLLKILSFYFVYKGVIQECLRDPYNNLFLDLKRSEERLREAEKELRVKNRALEAFIHTAAHDLRSPLSSISGYAQLLAQHVKNRDLSNMEMMTDHIREGVNWLDRLLKDLLDFAFVGRMATEPVPVDTAEVIRKIVQEKRDQISSVGAQIVLAEGLPTLHMARTEVYQVFSNLIANSLKFSRQAVSPRIEVKPGESEREGFGTVIVTDNGIGITPEDREKIFDLFVTLEHSRADGTGAGLAIVRRLVEHYGGSVHVDSVPEEGTTFTLTLPVA